MKHVLHVALSVSLGAALGGGFFAALLRSTPPPPEDPGSREALAKAIADLSSSVRALEGNYGPLRMPGAPGPTSRVAAGSSAVPPEDVGRTVRDLMGRLDVLQSAMAARFSAQPPLALQAARAPDPALLQDLRSRTPAERNREHAMWTFQEVLDRYGRPDEVDTYGDSSTIRWTYNLPGNRLLRFRFVQGYVIWVNDERQRL